MSLSTISTAQPSLQYLQRPQANGQPTVQPASGGNDHDGDEVNGVDPAIDNDKGSKVNIKA